MKKLLAVLVISALVALFAASGAAAVPTKVLFWHSMSSVMGQAVQDLVDKFNKSQKDVVVEAVYMGSYDDGINKLKAAIQAGTPPHVAQIYDIGTQVMIDSKAIVPVQQFIDRDKIDISIFQPNVISYYKVGGELYSMPFNSSTPIMYYNKNLFREAGLDPQKPPRTFEEVAEYAKRLTKRDASGNVTQWGVAWPLVAWFFEEYLANQNALFTDNNNGRTDNVTRVAFDSPAGIRTMKWWTDLIKEGYFPRLQRGWDPARQPFWAGKVGILMDSTANRAQHEKNIAGNFELGTAFLPYPAGTGRNGVVIGGGSVWMLKGHPKGEMEAAWEFVKFLIQPDQQVEWQLKTGYFPVRRDLRKNPVLMDFYKKNPNADTALEQLETTKVNYATQGALIGTFPEIRTIVEQAVEKIVAGQMTVEEAMAEAAKKANESIARYNRMFKK
ncbi:MAG: ABC transporter substrate-binding protein [Firmicutes bacterium]|nr:ABC transporter substrate-binding protein [Bacillota bacterium]